MGAFLISYQEAAQQHGACDNEVRGIVGRSVVIVVVSDKGPSVVDATRDGPDVLLHVPVLGHGYLDAAQDGADIDACGFLDYLGLPEVDGDATQERGEPAAAEVL